MPALLALVPLAVYALVVAALRCGRSGSDALLRDNALEAALVLGAGVAFTTELLSLFHLITFTSVLVCWVGALMIAGGTLGLRWRRYGAPVPPGVPRLDAVDGTLVLALAGLALALLLVAWLSPPQSSDSIGYHMSRIVHWIQNRSVQHYPTADPPQLFEPPFAEMVRLHLYLLSGGDRAGCLLQWLAAMGSLAAVSLVARDLGGTRRAQLFAAVLTLTLPIGVAQASSGKNGWVETLWLLSLVHFGGWLVSGRGAPLPARMVAAFVALGLELATKVSAWLFAPPVVAWTAVRALARPGGTRRQLLLPAAAGTLIALSIVAPYLVRNVSVYGHPLVDPLYKSKNALELLTPASVASNLVRNAAFQLGTGIKPVDAALTRAVNDFHEWIGLHPSDPRTTQFGPFRVGASSRIEEWVTSPLHVLLVFGTGIALLASRRLRAGGERLPYLVALAAAYVVYSAAIQWQPPNCRLLMPLLVLAAPLVAVVVSEATRGIAVFALSPLLFVAALPYVVNLTARPLSFEEGRGILATPREDLYFARVPGLRKTYREVAGYVLDSHVKNLGVVFTDDNEPEYLLWKLIKDVDPTVRIENVMVRDASQQLWQQAPFRGFQPDLVVIIESDERKDVRFDREIVAIGRPMTLSRRIGMAGVYVPAE